MKTPWDIDVPLVNSPRRVRLVLARHGESLWNVEHRVQGQLGPGLTEQGHRQAESLGADLVRKYGTADLVYTSDLARVTQTAAPYLAITGLTAVEDPRLREINSGEWSGRTTDEVAATEAEYIHRVRQGEDLPRGRTGETWADMHARTGDFLNSLRADAVRTLGEGERSTVIAFSHGGTIRAFCAEALGLPVGGHKQFGPVANCSVTVIDLIVDGTGAGFVAVLAASHESSGNSATPVEESVGATVIT